MGLKRKLGIRQGTRLAIIDPPVRFLEDLEPLPGTVSTLSVEDGNLDCIVLFTTSRSELDHSLSRSAAGLAPDGCLWVAWPKTLSGYETDVSVEVAQAAGMRIGLLDTRRLSLNDGWTAMRFIVRLDDRNEWSKRSFDE